MSKKTTEPIPVFVYGTLRKAVGHPVHRILDEHGVWESIGKFQGKLYDLGPFPGAVASGDGTEAI
jgi:pyruvate carboxylase